MLLLSRLIEIVLCYIFTVMKTMYCIFELNQETRRGDTEALKIIEINIFNNIPKTWVK